MHLLILGRRTDGYHELVTVFQSVDLFDSITIEKRGRGIDIEVVGGKAPADASNLAVRAAQAYLERFGDGTGLEITLEKRIPVGGGLGGGSSNAATVLVALNEMFNWPAPRSRLVQMAASLGADVPYFLTGGTALGKGRGDEIVDLEDLPEQPVDLLIPGCNISTAAVFREFDQLTVQPRRSSICALIGKEGAGPLSTTEGWNDLQGTVLTSYPEVKRVFDAVERMTQISPRLSGSGATLFIIPAPDFSTDDYAAELPATCRVVKSRTVSRQSYQHLRTVN